MNIAQFKRLVDNYLSGNASRREATLLNSYLDKAWEEKQLPSDAEEQGQEVWNRIRGEIAPPVRSIRVWRYAASALIMIAAGAGYKYQFELQDWLDPIPMQSATALKYQVKKITLPDSSVVILNSGSTLTWPQRFRGKHRNISVNGEAFFDVTPQTAPFIITGPHLQVKVLGTSFVVTDSSNIEKPKVSVKTGSVAVTAATVVQQLRENEELVYENGAINIYKQTEVNTGWTSKKLQFNESALAEVFGEMEKIYGIKIKTANRAIRDEKFTGAFEETDTVDDILKVIALSYRLTIHKDKDGTIVIR
ncbi:FecR family protein [Chitinophaga arvensicola]|uniref:Ferric-dicitrate binding protein FerR, regulates iron transport through sigma-19 n=1 Tax=Chitinophaga arvensicola TaxID=29529 RepID=A0A1I0SB89_9BACT|nr:FecR domain-containing protein [Chitinophaga arvensicola]SEW53921.1 ferric-dicitrate binding protein FerR, regulates iron transport through sigma-19 [Chitinophaga arvensicola]